MPLSEQTEARVAALHALWEHVIRCMAHHGLHADDAAPVIATIQARVEALRGQAGPMPAPDAESPDAK